MEEQRAHHWITLDRSGLRAGDLVSSDAGGLPIYRVLAFDEQRAWLREERSGRDHIAPLAVMRWKLAS